MDRPPSYIDLQRTRCGADSGLRAGAHGPIECGIDVFDVALQDYRRTSQSFGRGRIPIVEHGALIRYLKDGTIDLDLGENPPGANPTKRKKRATVKARVTRKPS
jgi:hypothetical protein